MHAILQTEDTLYFYTTCKNIMVIVKHLNGIRIKEKQKTYPGHLRKKPRKFDLWVTYSDMFNHF